MTLLKSPKTLMTVHSPEQQVSFQPRWAADKPAWKQVPVDLGMWAAGGVAVGLNGLLGSRACGRLGILMYHRVSPRIAKLPAPLYNIQPRSFAAQLEGLARRGFQFTSLQTALAAASRQECLPAKTVVLTFDDGFASVYTHAWPVLKRMGIPATVFVSTAYLDSDEPFPFDAWGTAHKDQAPSDSYRPLSTDECREMMDSGLVEIGAHTHTHQDFHGRPESFRKDLLQSVQIVSERFGLDEVPFAFPYGSEYSGFASADLRSAADSAGVQCGLTTTAELVNLFDSPFRWGRFNVFSWDTSATLAAKLGGWYSWAPKTRQSLARLLTRRIGPRESLQGAAGLAMGETLTWL